MVVREELLNTLREDFSAVGPMSLMLGPEATDPVEFSNRSYQHYLGDLNINLERVEELTRVIANYLGFSGLLNFS